MKVPVLACVAAAMTVAAMSNPAVGADDGSGYAPTKVDTSGPHSVEVVDEITPKLRKQFPGVGTLTERIPPIQLQRGGPAIDNLTDPTLGVDR